MTDIKPASAPRPAGVPAELTKQIQGEIAGRESRRRKILLGRILVIGGLIVAWEVFSGRLGEPGVLIDKFYLSQPSDVANALWQWIENGVLLTNLAATMQVTVLAS
jgi:ABC-type nitrate/sulfonate/bicarbonate transport system permease component